jgi:hypothetical protein
MARSQSNEAEDCALSACRSTQVSCKCLNLSSPMICHFAAKRRNLLLSFSWRGGTADSSTALRNDNIVRVLAYLRTHISFFSIHPNLGAPSFALLRRVGGWILIPPSDLFHYEQLETHPSQKREGWATPEIRFWRRSELFSSRIPLWRKIS